jgi:hypothetical protein
MGKYINSINGTPIGTSFQQKCANLISNGAEETTNEKFQENLICVVNNGAFAAAGYCYNEREFEAFNQPSDDRLKKWFILKDAAKYSD